jgi:hypothetical protein
MVAIVRLEMVIHPAQGEQMQVVRSFSMLGYFSRAAYNRPFLGLLVSVGHADGAGVVCTL